MNNPFAARAYTEQSDDDTGTDTVELTENVGLDLVVDEPDPLSDLENGIRELRKLQKRFQARTDVERSLRAEVTELRSQIATAFIEGRDDAVHDLARTLKNTNNNIDRQAERIDTLAAKVDAARLTLRDLVAAV